MLTLSVASVTVFCASMLYRVQHDAACSGSKYRHLELGSTDRSCRVAKSAAKTLAECGLGQRQG
jgi:hypothetical protein